MTRDPLPQIYRLFHEALQLPESQRAAFLEKECEADGELLNRLKRMIEYADGSGGVLSGFPHEQAQPQPERVFEPGELVSGRYRIENFLNLGGMGEVYSAFDLELDVLVALKTVRPEFASDERMLARFKREVQLEREVTHENVCPLYEFSRHQTETGATVHYLTMRLLAGETLAAHLKTSGALEPEEAVRIAGQIAAGLDAAHRAGILHRDLKSSNIMLVPVADGGSKAVVTDFGLARRIGNEDEARLTLTGQAMGTLDYMAPELLAGKSATTASDVYAFGIIFYEMSCGARPFADAEPHVAAYRRSQAVPPITAQNLAPGWRRLIERCLAPDPAMRPELRDVVHALETSAPLAPARKKFAVFGKKAALIVAAALIAVLSLFFAGLRLFRQSESVQPGSVIYLADLNSATRDPQLDSSGELLRNHLLQSGRIRLADDAKVERAKSLIRAGSDPGAAAREVALRVGAAFVVFSTLVRLGDSYRFTIRMDRVGSSPMVYRKSIVKEWQAGGKQQIFAVLKEAGSFIRTSAGEQAESVANQDISPEEAASSSWDALDLYRQSGTLRREKKIDAAIAALNRAIEIDPDFAMAHIRLADILNGVRRQEEAFEHYRRAMQAASNRRLTRWEELLLRGNYALDTGGFTIAEAAFGELRRLYPHLYLPPHYLAAAVREQGRLEESVQLEREAASRDPEMTQPVVGSLGVLISLGRYSDADAEVRRLRELSADLALEYEGELLFLRGDFAGAVSRFESVSRSADPRRRGHGFSLLGQFYAETGQYARAAAAYSDGIAADMAAGLAVNASAKHVAIAWLDFCRNDLVSARNHALEAVRLVRAVELFRRAGMILARAGFVNDAQNLIDDLGPRWPGPLAEAARHHIRGEIMLVRGQTSAAVRELETADRLDSPPHLREYLAHGYARAHDRDRAAFLYDKMLASPGVFWQYADCELPGARAGMLLETAQLAHDSGQEARMQALLREYRKIRGSADPSLPETLRAQRLLAGSH